VAREGPPVSAAPSDAAIREIETTFAVRSYELDSYGHLNHGVYVAWFEEAREAFLRRGGFDYGRFPRDLGLWFVVARIEVDFRRSLNGGETARLRTRLAKIGDRSVVFRQALFRSADDALSAEARVVMCFSKDGAAAAVPDAFRAAFATHALGDVGAAPPGRP
jgi:YbgC/YbaW family acyl-CoA thioester hydrolase